MGVVNSMPYLTPTPRSSHSQHADRLPWPAGLAVEAWGVKLGIRVNPSEAISLLSAYLPPRWRSAASPEVDYLCSIILGGTHTVQGESRYDRLYSGSTRVVRTLNRERIWQELASSLNFHVALLSPSWVFVHAGVVAWHNQAIVIPGRSCSGKTTLVKALVDAGATYYSDEYAVLDPNGSVHPYPKPLNIRQRDGERTVATSVEEIGGQVGHEALRVSWIIDTAYCAGSRWCPKPIAPEQAFLRLFDNTVIARLDPERVFPVLRNAVCHSRALQGTRGEAEEVVKQLPPFLETEPAFHRPSAEKEISCPPKREEKG